MRLFYWPGILTLVLFIHASSYSFESKVSDQVDSYMKEIWKDVFDGRIEIDREKRSAAVTRMMNLQRDQDDPIVDRRAALLLMNLVSDAEGRVLEHVRKFESRLLPVSRDPSDVKDSLYLAIQMLDEGAGYLTDSDRATIDRMLVRIEKEGRTRVDIGIVETNWSTLFSSYDDIGGTVVDVAARNPHSGRSKEVLDLAYRRIGGRASEAAVQLIADSARSDGDESYAYGLLESLVNEKDGFSKLEAIRGRAKTELSIIHQALADVNPQKYVEKYLDQVVKSDHVSVDEESKRFTGIIQRAELMGPSIDRVAEFLASTKTFERHRAILFLSEFCTKLPRSKSLSSAARAEVKESCEKAHGKLTEMAKDKTVEPDSLNRIDAEEAAAKIRKVLDSMETASILNSDEEVCRLTAEIESILDRTVTSGDCKIEPQPPHAVRSQRDNGIWLYVREHIGSADNDTPDPRNSLPDVKSGK